MKPLKELIRCLIRMAEELKPTNFIREIIDVDLKNGVAKYATSDNSEFFRYCPFIQFSFS